MPYGSAQAVPHSTLEITVCCRQATVDARRAALEEARAAREKIQVGMCARHKHVRIRIYVRGDARNYEHVSVMGHTCGRPSERTCVRTYVCVCCTYSSYPRHARLFRVHGQVEKAQMDKARDFQKWVQVEYPVELACRIIGWRESLSDAGRATLQQDFFIERLCTCACRLGECTVVFEPVLTGNTSLCSARISTTSCPLLHPCGTPRSRHRITHSIA